MSHKDIREFITKLEEEGELNRIKAEVDWDLELSAIMRKVFEKNGLKIVECFGDTTGKPLHGEAQAITVLAGKGD